MNIHKKLWKALAVGGIAIGFAMMLAVQTPITSAQEPSPRPHGIATFFGMQTLAPTQTAQITGCEPSPSF